MTAVVHFDPRVKRLAIIFQGVKVLLIGSPLAIKTPRPRRGMGVLVGDRGTVSCKVKLVIFANFRTWRLRLFCSRIDWMRGRAKRAEVIRKVQRS